MINTILISWVRKLLHRPNPIFPNLASFLEFYIFEHYRTEKQLNEFEELEKYFKRTGYYLNKAMKDFYLEQDEEFKEKIDKKLNEIVYSDI